MHMSIKYKIVFFLLLTLCATCLQAVSSQDFRLIFFKKFPLLSSNVSLVIVNQSFDIVIC
jgi:hypothetical protein